MAKDCNGSKDLNCFKMKVKTFREAVWPDGEQAEIKLVIQIRLWITHCLHHTWAPVADVSCFSARVKEDFFFLITEFLELGAGESPLSEDEVGLELGCRSSQGCSV